MQASGARAYNDLARVRYRNWISSVNSDSGAWLSAGLSPKLFQMSNNEFVSAVCRRNTFEGSLSGSLLHLGTSLVYLVVDAMGALA